MQGCNLAHILGLYKMTGKSGLAFELTAAGSIADVVLWGIARLQMRMYASETFQRCADPKLFSWLEINT